MTSHFGGVVFVVVCFYILFVANVRTRKIGALKKAKTNNCPKMLMRYQRRCGGDEIKRNISALWEKVNSLSSPINIYVNGKQFAEIDPRHSDGHHVHGSDGKHTKSSDESCDGFMYAKCDMKPNTAAPSQHNIQGTIHFRQKPSHDLEVKVHLSGFHVSGDRRYYSEQLHAIHLHEFGDLSKGCSSFGGHFNPLGSQHGGPGNQESHVGDWGNLSINRTGQVETSKTLKQSALFGPNSVAGRGLVIHAGADDLGTAHSHSSKTTGNAGGRVACCAVVYQKGDCQNWGR